MANFPVVSQFHIVKDEKVRCIFFISEGVPSAGYDTAMCQERKSFLFFTVHSHEHLREKVLGKETG